MNCPYCNQPVSDDAAWCPFCGREFDDSVVVPGTEPESFTENYSGSYSDGYSTQDNNSGIVSSEDSDFNADYNDLEDYAEEPELRSSKKFGIRRSAMSLPKFSPATVLSIISVIVTLICLFMIASLKSELAASREALSGQLYGLSSSVSALDNRLAALDTTIAGVQQEAYNQLAEQTIIISKNIMPLTGPVTEGKYNVMFIINAKGNLTFSKCFDWQKFNEATSQWESIEFSGNYTTNDEMGLRISNSYDSEKSIYVTELWANGITYAAEGRYRCVITDDYGVSKSSDETTVLVQAG